MNTSYQVEASVQEVYGKINYTELQVLKYLIKGMSVQEIASRTYTTDKRIYNLRSSIERKMGIAIKRML